LDQGIPLIHRLVTDGRVFFWGESALPNFLVICWLLEQSGQSWLAEGVMLGVVGALTKFNQKLSANPLSGPEVLPDEVFSSILKKNAKPEMAHGRRAPVSWSLESLLHLWDITHVEMASFRPNRAADALLWFTNAGEEMERLAGKPQSWKEFTDIARTNDLNALPAILRNDPDFALMFMLAYPHRASTTLVKALDKWFE
jgi:hypothetical protein